MQSAQTIVMMLLMFGVFWFVLIRPQMKRQKQHQQMLTSLKKGDMVVTRGGLVGKITGMSDAMLTLELQEKVRVRVLRAYVESRHDLAKDSVETEKAA